MSVEAVKWAMYDAPMLLTSKGRPDSTARQVLAVLAEHANRRGSEAYPSVSRIRYATGLDERTIQRALLRLERGGLTARDGFGPAGTVCWKLAVALRRPETDWSTLMVGVEQSRRVESDRRRARRLRDTSALSGTENPGHGDVRDAECRRPGRKIPASGTQSADVRDAAPPEPSFEPPMNHPEPPSSCTVDPAGPRAASPEEEGEEISNDQQADNHTTASGIADRYRPGITAIEAKRLAHPIAEALRNGWTVDAIRTELDADHTGLANLAAGLITRARTMATSQPSAAPPAKAVKIRPDAHEFEPDTDGITCQRCQCPRPNARHLTQPSSTDKE